MEEKHIKEKETKIYIIRILIFIIISISVFSSLPGSLQVGGGGEELTEMIHNPSKIASALAVPISSTYGFVTSTINKILKILLIVLGVIFFPVVPLVLYIIVAFFMIRKFLGFFSS